MTIKSFDELTITDKEIAGGKGASLGFMRQYGLQVPHGFVILSSAFNDYINRNNLSERIRSELSRVDINDANSIVAASENITLLITQGAMDQDFERNILASFDDHQLTSVAVRSSATAEDGHDHAWAGQLESFLNVRRENLLSQVKNCWASLFTPRAIHYRIRKGLLDKNISVAVVVQKMIFSSVSGIAFSVHPVTRDHSSMIIEAAYGLCDAVVSGQVTPDSYILKKENGEITDMMISCQQRKMISIEDGTGWDDVEESSKERQKLEDHLLRKLTKTVTEIESYFGFPVDIEWGIDNEELYIFQARPITTL